MRNIDLTNVTEASDFQRPTAGPYICNITKVEDKPVDASGKGDYLHIWYDIAEGDFKGYYADIRADHPDWVGVGSYYRSYKETALGMFKRMCSAITKSNPGFEFGEKNHDESTLVGKKVGLIFQEEEYYGNDGSLKTRLIVQKEFPVDEIDAQKVPDKKTVDGGRSTGKADDGFSVVTDTDSLPF